LWLIQLFIVSYALGTSLVVWLLLRSASIKSFIYTGKDFVISRIGNSGAKVVAKALIPIVIAGVAEVVAQATQTELNYHACKRYTKACNDAGIPVHKMEELTTPRGGLGPLARDAIEAVRNLYSKK